MLLIIVKMIAQRAANQFTCFLYKSINFQSFEIDL